ncbi:hypothetical protein HT031_000940 [Scenedesmus sp. PABB004]|nr:hypothetical protein HT031_000940 [Scenedesmus sp. PABB004]
MRAAAPPGAALPGAARAPGARSAGAARVLPRLRRGGAAAAGEKLARELLDVVTAGPKMRKWYGQQSSLPRDGGEPPEQQQQPQEQQEPPEDGGARDIVLVTDADSPTGELVVLQLILLGARIRILVRDTAAAKQGYGPYVEAVSVDLGSPQGAARALRGVRAVVALGRLGALLPAAEAAGVERVVLLSTAGMPQPGGLAALFQDAADAGLKDPAREAACLRSAIPHVVVKAGPIRDVPGGASSIAVAPAPPAGAGGAPGGAAGGGGGGITREDLASAVVAAATALPGLDGRRGAGLVFSVSEAGPGAPPASYDALLEGLLAGEQARA